MHTGIISQDRHIISQDRQVFSPDGTADAKFDEIA
jgi:hypothetical protein